jgi:nitrite reductase/ring-hydroxylating ferredoxin subunit
VNGLRKIYLPVIRIEEAPKPGASCSFYLEDQECVLFCLEDEVYHATTALCPHQNEDIDKANLEGYEVVCRRHHLRFDIRTGDCVNACGYTLQTIEIRIKDGMIYAGVWED